MSGDVVSTPLNGTHVNGHANGHAVLSDENTPLESSLLQTQWQTVSERLHDEVGDVAFRTWLRSIMPESLSDGELTLSLTSAFLRDHVKNNFDVQLRSAWQAENATVRRIAFKVRKNDAPKSARARSALPLVTDWTDPDMTVLCHGRRKPPALPLEGFGPWWEEWIQAAAECGGCSPDYVAMPLLSAAAMCLGNARWISPWDGWKEPPVLWCGSVGDSGSNKSPGTDAVKEALGVLQCEMASGFGPVRRAYLTSVQVAKVSKELWDKEVKLAKKLDIPVPDIPDDAVEPQKPVVPRIVIQDTTPEKIGELLSVHRKGLFYFRDELAGWFGSFDKYGGAGSERALWLEAHGGRSYSIDRVKHPEPIIIPHLTVGVFGGIQPDRLNVLLTGPDDGLAARFLWSWPDDEIEPERPQRAPDMGAVIGAFRRLLELPMVDQDDAPPRPFMLRLEEEAIEIFVTWRKSHRNATRHVRGIVGSAMDKMPGQLLRLALVLEHLWWAAPGRDNTGRLSWKMTRFPEIIGPKAIVAAARLIDTYFKPMAERVYGDAALPQQDRSAATVAQWIVREKIRRVNARELRRKTRLPGLKEAGPVQAALTVLEEAGWLRFDPSREGDQAGRVRQDYEVNPSLWRNAHAVV